MQSFGDRIKQIRIEREMSQQELADFLGTSKQVISRYETGQRTPKINIANEYAQKLGVALNYLLGEDSEINSVSTRDEKDVEKILAQAREQLMAAGTLMFDGEPATQEDIEAILSAMEVGVALAKKKAKEKYTPKKYRK